MEQIINGLKYDTKVADLVASDRYWDGYNWNREGRNTYLYRTKAKRFFIYRTSQWQGERNHIEPVGLNKAKYYYEELPEHDMSYVEAFGVEPEEA